ncbi:MAG: recombinase family protein [Clostridiales bacterium]|jgi:DNA invertase Pin-like site-specific DNA recombinase|nr:recombinase family protein [Eubacteriales bacterium]MDH7565173.1 recombinase family protein [Clostridiales bacterium]
MMRVAAYCRVSTDKGDQVNSLENQKRYFKEYIMKNEGWEFVNLYVDEGISGTNVKRRSGFRQMVADAENNKFDLLLTKEISRFARNTLDSIFYIRKLRSKGIGIIFMNDNINTLDPDSELRLTIMASIAQEESRKISERVKWGQKRSMENGVVFGSRIYGYDIKNGKIYVNEREAEVVKLIFKLYYEEGMGTHLIAKKLDGMGIRTPSGAQIWSNATILKILKNEKYKGQLKQKKEITTDFLTHSRKANRGEEEFIVIEDNHEAIIDKNMFDAVQQEIKRRSRHESSGTKYSNRYVWSGKIICGLCGAKFKRKVWHSGKAYQRVVWQCTENIKYGSENFDEEGRKKGCSCKAVPETVLEQLFLWVLSDVVKNKSEVVKNLENAIFKALGQSENAQALNEALSRINKLKRRKERLIDLYSDGLITKNEFTQRNDEYNKQLEGLDRQLGKRGEPGENQKENERWLQKIKSTVEELVNANVFSEEICKQLLNKIIIYDRHHFKIIFNGNIEKQAFLDVFPPITQSQLQKEQSRLPWRKCP